MKFTLSWLKDHLETEASLEEICTTLSAVGLEVEGVENPAEQLGAFVIARVVEAKQHPDADKLRVCMVDYGGSAPVQVVCGAPNARTGLVGVFAPEGTYVPGTDLLLKKAKIRGVESSGMLCSERELQLSDEHDGIIDLDPGHADFIGLRFVDVANLNDPVIDVAITPNRPDALGVRGIARDLAAAGLGKLKPDPYGKPVPGKFKCPVAIELEFDRAHGDACPLFAGRVIRGVKNVPSPDWLQQRLRAIGLRPISGLVDVTNYLTYDRARPLHVYDVSKLKGTIRARLGRSGEAFDALDGKRYDVEDGMTVIADDARVLGFGGIIGGTASGATEDTTEVLIEAAYFDPIRTANTGRRTGIHSDARYRFERGVDPASAVPGLEQATRMILDICGGEPSDLEIAGSIPEGSPDIRFDTDEVKRLTGLEFKDKEIKSILKDLGFVIEGRGSKFDVIVPSWRPDVHGPADLVEEVIRIHGIDNVKAEPLARPSGVARPVLTDRQKRVRLSRRVLASRGLVEAVTWSFVSDADASRFGGDAPGLRLANPISSELSTMRPSLLPGLLAAAGRNVDRSISDPALFEVGQVYDGEEPDQQFTAAAGVRIGSARLSGSGRHWQGDSSSVDLFDAKSDLIALLEAMGVDASKAQTARDVPAWFHPGRAGVLKLGPKITLGVFGELHPRTLQQYDIEGPVVAMETRIESLPASRRKLREKGALAASDLQPVRRDFAFVVDRDVGAADIVRAALGADKATIAGVSIFDVFEGPSIGEGKKSIGLEVVIQPSNATLTDEAIEAISQKVIAQVKKATGGEIRG